MKAPPPPSPPSRRVVAPRCDVRSPEAVAVSISSGTLAGLRTCDTLAEALRGTSASVAFTR